MYDLYFLSHCMQPEGLWQRLAAALYGQRAHFPAFKTHKDPDPVPNDMSVMPVARVVCYGNRPIVQGVRRWKQEGEGSLGERIMGSKVQWRKKVDGSNDGRDDGGHDCRDRRYGARVTFSCSPMPLRTCWQQISCRLMVLGCGKGLFVSRIT